MPMLTCAACLDGQGRHYALFLAVHTRAVGMSAACTCIQARVAAAGKAMLTQRSAGGDVEETAEEDMTATEALELEMTEVLDDEKEQDTPDSGLHREDKAAAALHGHDAFSNMGLRNKVAADEEQDLTLEAHSQHRAPGTLHRHDAAQHDDNDADEDDDGEAIPPSALLQTCHDDPSLVCPDCTLSDAVPLSNQDTLPPMDTSLSVDVA